MIRTASLGLIPHDWQNGIEQVDYKVFDLAEPHCATAAIYRDVRGQIRYRCQHMISPHPATLATGHAMRMGLLPSNEKAKAGAYTRIFR